MHYFSYFSLNISCCEHAYTPWVVDCHPIWPDGASRRKAIDTALEPSGRLDVMSAHDAEEVDAWLDHPAFAETGKVIDMELASDDPDDLTLRQARWLAQADQVIAGADVPEEILNRARADAERSILSPWDERPVEGLVVRIRMKT